MNEYFVSAAASPEGDGSESRPFSRIQEAADVATSGDTVRILPGLYREWVQPRRGGTVTAPIVYQAEGAGVCLTASERVTGWRSLEEGLWCVTLEDSFFGEFHSLREAREGDWFHPLGREHWLGELFVDGTRIHDVGTVEEVRSTVGSWTRILGDQSVEILLHVETNPSQVELGVRPACFYPEKTGLDYITVRGLEMCHAASPWAPPTAEQVGMVGPRWSKGWVIEDCHLHDASGCALSLGLPDGFGDNEWSRNGRKHGSQRQREMVFRALNAGWSFETIGSHEIRGCHIHHCGQAGIVGHLGGIGCRIMENHIHDVFRDRPFAGHEMAGIKLHAALDTQLERNWIHDCCRGIWLDWQAQGTRVTGNWFHDNDWEDLYSEVNHGPLLVDQNVFLSPVAFSDCSQGLAFVHNLVAGQLMQLPIPNRFTPYHVPHSTEVAGVMTIPGGDARFLNNLFLSSPETRAVSDSTAEDENRDLKVMPRVKGHGTALYDRYPGQAEEWRPLGGNVNDYGAIRHPVFCSGNLYTGAAAPHRCEANPQCFPEWDPQVSLDEQGVRFTLPDGGMLKTRPCLQSESLEDCIQSEMGFELPDGTACEFGEDLDGVPRTAMASPGPWESLCPGRNHFSARDGRDSRCSQQT